MKARFAVAWRSIHCFCHLSMAKLFTLPNGKTTVLLLISCFFSIICCVLSTFVIQFSMNVSLSRDPTPFVAGWWAQVDSNYRPRAYQARALAC